MNFVPDGKSIEYIKSFQKAMSEVYLPILEDSNKMKKELMKKTTANK